MGFPPRPTTHTDIQKERALDVAYAMVERKAAYDAYILASRATYGREDIEVDPKYVETLHAANQKRDRALHEFAISMISGQ